MIDKVIILSRKINAVSEGAENFYYRIYVNTDDFGLFHADPEILKGQIYTLRKNISIEIIKARLKELAEIKLIKLYRHNDETYLEIVDFEQHQTFRKDYKRKRKYPTPTKESHEVVQTRTKSLTNINKINSNQIKLKEEGPQTNIPANQELQIITELSTVKGLGDKKIAMLIRYIRKLSIEFPDVDYVYEVKKKVAWWLDHPINKKSNLHLQLRNWFIISQKGFDEAKKQHRVGKDYGLKKTKYPAAFLNNVYAALRKQGKNNAKYSRKIHDIDYYQAGQLAIKYKDKPAEFINFLENK